MWKHCYHGNKGLFNNSTIWKYFKFIIDAYALWDKGVNGLPCCYGNTVPDMFLRIIHISVLLSCCGNTVTHQNQMLTAGAIP